MRAPLTARHDRLDLTISSLDADQTTDPLVVERASDDLLVSRTVHELASPLTVVGGFAETLLRHHADMSNAQRERYLVALQRHTARLQRVVADLGHLQGARTNRTRVVPSMALIDAAVLDALQIAASVHGFPASGTIHDLAAAMGVELVIEEGAAAWVDETHLVRILVNLIDNAVKYGQAPITVTARTTSTEVTITVADEGDGIPERLHQRVFQPYERGDDHRLAGIQGSGLGLSIVLELARCNGGTIRLVPTTAGCCFEVVLPRRMDGQIDRETALDEVPAT